MKSSDQVLLDLTKKVEALEERLNKMEDDEGKKEKKKDSGIVDSISDAGDKLLKESGKLISSIADASAEGMKEGLDAFTSAADDKDKDELGEIPSTILSIFRKTIDVQKKVLDKFETSYKSYDKS